MTPCEGVATTLEPVSVDIRRLKIDTDLKQGVGVSQQGGKRLGINKAVKVTPCEGVATALGKVHRLPPLWAALV